MKDHYKPYHCGPTCKNCGDLVNHYRVKICRKCMLRRERETWKQRHPR